MFLVDCHQHGAPVLLGPRSIRALTNTSDGIVLQWTCHCGATGAQRYGDPVDRAHGPTESADHLVA